MEKRLIPCLEQQSARGEWTMLSDWTARTPCKLLGSFRKDSSRTEEASTSQRGGISNCKERYELPKIKVCLNL